MFCTLAVSTDIGVKHMNNF